LKKKKIQRLKPALKKKELAGKVPKVSCRFLQKESQTERDRIEWGEHDAKYKGNEKTKKEVEREPL